MYGISSFKDTVAWLSIMFGCQQLINLNYFTYNTTFFLSMAANFNYLNNVHFTNLALSNMRISQNVMCKEILFFKLDLYTLNLHLLFTKAFKIYHVKAIRRKGQK